MKKLKSKKLIFIVISVLILVGVVIFGVSRITEKETIITKSTLEKIIQTSELSTAEFVNNSVLTVYNEKKPEKVDYYVSYESTVSVGIDLREIQVDEPDTEKKEITVRIPEMKINEVVVDQGSLEYIFNDDKLDTHDTAVLAYKLCIADAQKKAMDNEDVLQLARENTVNFIKGLIEPLVEQLDEKYTVKIVDIEEA
ncbi:MAG: DUF4230 domain-containing protein [Acutalibacteraceae bacterium]